MTAPEAETVAAAVLPATVDAVEPIPAIVVEEKGGQHQGPLNNVVNNKGQARPPPISILKAPRPTPDSATLAKTPQLLNSHGSAMSPIASTPTLGKRPRSPNDLYTQLMVQDKSKDAKKRQKAYRVRWKSNGELEQVREIYQMPEEMDDESFGARLSHQEEGEMLKKATPLLEWHSPRPLAIPQAYLQRVIRSGDMGRAAVSTLDVEAEDGAASDTSAGRSPTDTLRSLPPEQTGLRDHTITVYLPDELLFPDNYTQFDYQQQQQLPTYQYEDQTGSAEFSIQPTNDQEQPEYSYDVPTGPRGLRFNGETRGAERSSSDWAQYGQASNERRSSKDEEGRYRDAGYPDQRGNGRNRVDSGAGRDSLEDRDTTRDAYYYGRRDSMEQASSSTNESHYRYEAHNLPLPRGQPTPPRWTSNPTKTTSAKAAWGAESTTFRSASSKEYSRRNNDDSRSGEATCHFFRTPGGCKKGRACDYKHP